MNNGDVPPESPLPASLSENSAHTNPESSACIVEAENLGPEQQSKVREDSVPVVLPDSDVPAMDKHAHLPTEDAEILEPRDEKVVAGSSEVHDIPSPHSLETSVTQLIDNPTNPELNSSVPTADLQVNDVMPSDASAMDKHAHLPTEDAEILEPRDEKVVAGSSEVHDIPSPHSLETSVTQLIDNPTNPELNSSVPTADLQVNDIMPSDASIEVRAPEDDLQNVVQSDPSEHQVEVACVPKKKSVEPTEPSKQREHVDVKRGLIDTATPFESVKEAVTKFGGIIDWKAHKIQTVERRKLVENELENAQEELPKYKKQSEDAKEAEAQVLKDLDSSKRLIEELKLNLERAQTEEHQAKQDSELAKLRVEEMEQGVADDASVAAKAQLEVAKTRHTAALTELKSVKDDLEKLRVDYASLVAEKDVAVKRAAEADSASKEVDKTVEDLTLELITIKASLESAHAAHLEAEERRIGAAMARDQDTLNWEKELKQAEAELQRLNQQLLSEKDLKLSLDTSSSLLLNLKSELLAYMEAKLNQESGVEQSSEDALEESKNKTHMDLQAAVTSAKEELEKMKINIEKVTKEANCLKLAAVSLHLELESEKSALATMRQREGMASVAVSSLEADLNKTNAEVSLVQMKEKEFRENMVVLPRKLQKVAQEADQAKSIAQLARKELQKAKEEAEEVKACASTIESRLHAAQMEIEAARESERLALAAAKALQESELTTATGDEDAPSGVTLSMEEYHSLSKQTQEAEERASIKVAAAISQIEEAKLSQLRTFSELDEVNREIAARKEALRIVMEKAEKANEGKLGVEQELRNWRSEHELKRRASNVGQGAVDSPRSQRSFEEKKEPKSFEKDATIPVQPVLSTKVDILVNNTDLDSPTEKKMVVKKKNKLLPRIAKFWGRKNEQAAKL